MVALGFQIVGANLGLDPYFLEFGDLLVTLGIALFPALFVPILTVIHQATNRRRSVWCDFNEVQASLTRHLKCFPGGNHTELVAFVVN